MLFAVVLNNTGGLIVHKLRMEYPGNDLIVDHQNLLRRRDEDPVIYWEHPFLLVWSCSGLIIESKLYYNLKCNFDTDVCRHTSDAFKS